MLAVKLLLTRCLAALAVLLAAFAPLGSASLSPSLTSAQVVVPAAPTEFRATAEGDSALRLTWKDNATNETGCELWRWEQSTGWVLSGVPAANASSFVDRGLAPGATYWYYLAAWNGVGYSQWVFVSAMLPIRGPSPLRVAAAAPDALRLQWQDNATNEEGYELWRWDQIIGWVLSGRLPANTVSYVDRGLRPGAYYYYLAAYAGMAYSEWASTAAPVLPRPAGVKYQVPAGYLQTFAGPDWKQSPQPRPGFIMGHTITDYFSTAYADAYLDSTVKAVSEAGGGWVLHAQQATYHSVEPPVIGDTKPRNPYTEHREATEEELGRMVGAAKARGLKFGLMLEVTPDGLRETGGVNASLTASDQASAVRAEETIERWANRLEPGDLAAQAYWDAWFDQYGAFVLKQAEIAQKLGIDLMAVGKQAGAATRGGNASRWKRLIAQVRQRYTGKLTYVSWTSETASEHGAFPFEDLDYITFYLATKLSDADQPSVAEMKAVFEKYNDEIFEPASKTTGKPVLFLARFQSRTQGARNEWFESGLPQPQIGEDLPIQARMYEAFFQAMEDEPWVAGTFSWGFWWRDDFDTIFNPGEASINKGSSIRNKPVTGIWRRWAGEAP